MKTIVVVGAGVVGCATAYQLCREGAHVVVVDAADGPAEGASKANGAQLSYSYVEPLASPATLRSLPRLLLSGESPLRFRPTTDWRQWLWGLQFLKACSAVQSRTGTRQLIELAHLSRRTLDEWRETDALNFSFRQNGKLVLCPNRASLERQRQQVELQARWGCRQQVLSRDECLRREPALGPYGAHIAGGIWTEDECLGDAHELSQELMRRVSDAGGDFRFATCVKGFEFYKGAVSALKTDRGPIEGDAFVLANGANVATLGAVAGLKPAVYPIKGYSLTLDVRDHTKMPKTSVTDLRLKTVFAPLRDKMRIAAMAEMTGYDMSISSRQIDRMLRDVDTVFPGACHLTTTNPWAGLRPATPTSLPFIGRTGVRNLYLNVGQGALGFTLAAGSAVRLARAVLGEAGTS